MRPATRSPDADHGATAIRDAIEAVYGPVPAEVDASWIVLPGVLTASQGWKLHISATLLDASTVLDRVVPVLHQANVAAKVASSLAVLGELNDGWRGPSQIGKFVTVYPGSDEQAVTLAGTLDDVTAGLRGPVVPSDRSLRAGSLVHYRYGAFVDRPLRTPIGEIVLAVTAADGSLVPDVRDTVYRPPALVSDPFLAAGVAHALPSRPLVVADRYLTAATLHRSARGPVYLGIDLQDQRRCVLKRAVRNATARTDGQDAHTLLRHEYAMLERIRDCRAFPEPFELVEDGPDLYLVMEDVAGPALDQAALDLAPDGRAGQVARWAVDLAGILDHLHRRRIVHGDVKPANVVVTANGAVRLLDFDLAFDLDGTGRITGAGSTGYRSPQRATWATPDPLDDVWALGATALAALTGISMPHVPDPRRLAGLPGAAFAAGTPVALLHAIRGCLATDPAQRWASMAEAAAAFDVVGGPAPSTAPAGPPAPYRAESLTLARRTADALIALGVRHSDPDLPPALVPPGALSWRSAVIRSQHGMSADLNAGTAGPALALAEAVDTFGDPHHREALAAAAAWLLDPPRPQGYRSPGLWVGESGAGAALLRAGQVLAAGALVDAAVEVGRQVAALPHESPDFYNGSAGRLLFHLLLWDETGDDEHLRAAVDAGHAIERCARWDEGQVRWVFPAGFDVLSGDSRTLGYAHGVAGIADSLLDLADAARNDRWLRSAEGAVRYLAAAAEPLNAGSAAAGLGWPRVAGDPLTRPAWCHGAVGIGRFLIRASRFGLPDGARLAQGAAAAAAAETMGAMAGQCHGKAGVIEFLLDTYQATGDPRQLAAARQLESLMTVHSFEVDGHLQWVGERPGHPAHEYAVGAAGLIPCLLRLAEPERRPTQLSRAGFRWASRPAG